MATATMEDLRLAATALGVLLSDEALARLEAYRALLLRWNARINLTRIDDPGAVLTHHFLDSLAVAPQVPTAATLVDVGSGAGFPGAVLAVVRPDLPRVTLVEAVGKKCAFLEALRRELGLPLEVLPRRLESLGERAFDLAVSRATFAPEEWLRRGQALVGPRGRLVAMLGRERPAPSLPGFGPPRLLEYALPGGEQRALLVLDRQE